MASSTRGSGAQAVVCFHKKEMNPPQHEVSDGLLDQPPEPWTHGLRIHHELASLNLSEPVLWSQKFHEDKCLAAFPGEYSFAAADTVASFASDRGST
jgi:hypothetical protein